MPRGNGLADKAIRAYLGWHTDRLFAGGDKMPRPAEPPEPVMPRPDGIRDIAARLAKAERPVMVCGSQAMNRPQEAEQVRAAIEKLGVPVYLSGMSRGLLGKAHPLLFRHRRRDAIKGADLVILAGVPCDFRLDYGKQIRRSARLVSFNLSRRDLRLNRKPDDGLLADPGICLRQLAEAMDGPAPAREAWLAQLRERDAAREADIDAKAAVSGEGVNPLRLCREIDAVLPDDSVLVADGGDFVGTASYTVRPRGPLRWLAPGAFGTLGVGGGFAIGAARARPGSEIWILYGDGSLGYSLIEFDSYARHGMAPIAIIGNDACWAQIAREQVKMLKDDVGVRLARTDYHRAAEGLGGAGLVITRDEDVAPTLARARELAAAGTPVLVNVHLAETDFREGSLSI
jgi:acetolactate synthase-1/2/3 large subunit